MGEKIDTQSTVDSSAPFVIDGGSPALSAPVAEKCNLASGQQLTGAEKRVRADLARKAERRELDACRQFGAFFNCENGRPDQGCGRYTADLTWKGVEGKKNEKARLVARDHQDPDLKDGDADIAGCVSRGPPHLRLVSLGAPENGTSGVWKLTERAGLAPRFSYVPHVKGYPKITVTFRDCGPRRMVLMMPQRQAISPCASIW